MAAGEGNEVAMRKAAPPAPGATHLAASLRVVGSYLHTRRASIDDARDEVLQATLKIKTGTASPGVETLAARLERVTGVGLAELAKHAEGWREV